MGTEHFSGLEFRVLEMVLFNRFSFFFFAFRFRAVYPLVNKYTINFAFDSKIRLIKFAISFSSYFSHFA